MKIAALIGVINIIMIVWSLFYFSWDYRKIGIFLIALTIVCILGWLAYIPVWTINREKIGKSFKINTYQKIRGLDY